MAPTPVRRIQWVYMSATKGLLSTKRIKERRRIQKAVELAAEGTPWPVIAIQLGYKDEANAKQAVRRAIESVSAPAAGMYRELQLQRLELAVEALMPQVRDGDLKAIDVLVKVHERESKLLGLDGGGQNDPETEEARRKRASKITSSEEDTAVILKVIAESGGFAELLAEGTPLASLFLPEGMTGDDDDIPMGSEDPQIIEHLAESFRAGAVQDNMDALAVQLGDGVSMIPPRRGW